MCSIGGTLTPWHCRRQTEPCQDGNLSSTPRVQVGQKLDNQAIVWKDLWDLDWEKSEGQLVLHYLPLEGCTFQVIVYFNDDANDGEGG